MTSSAWMVVSLLLGASGQEQPEPAEVDEELPAITIVVTGTRTPRPLREVPAPVTVIPREELDRSPLLTTDSLLRTVPSVATFRRSTSLVADPSSQGMNLRGVGPSGVSRGLLWVDGIPANDPFGGWIYWRSLPRLGLQRIEIVPGGGSSLYGSSALGGVAQLLSRPIRGRALEAELLGGSFGTWQGAFRGAERFGDVGAALEAEASTTSGHPVVAPAERGSIDGLAWSRHATANGTVEYAASERLSLRGTARFFAEEQNGGTTFTTAGVQLGQVSLGADWRLASGAALELLAFGKLQQFDQTRARVTDGRSLESRSAAQVVPANEQGLTVLFRPATLTGLGGEHTLLLGADLRRVAGHADESLFPVVVSADTVVRRDAGGEQLFAGVFAQDSLRLGEQVEIVGALRLDAWRNQSGQLRRELGSGVIETESFASRNEVQLSPRLGVLYRPTPSVSLRASAYRAFRAPMLNELYRPFQVGTVLTSANALLRAESLLGGEVGVEVFPLEGWVLRANAFWNELVDPVSNVTLETPLPDGSQRQRQNLGRARIPGIELGTELRLARRLSVLLAYTFVDPRVTEADRPELIGNLLPQDPQHRGTAQVVYSDPRYVTATAQLRVSGPQFENDLNTLPMGGFALVDLSLAIPVWKGLQFFAAVENLFDRTYLVGRAGVDTIGQPRLIRGGIRLRER